MNLLKNFWRDDRGQDVVEYTLLMAAMALACAAVVVPMKQEVSAIWSATNTALVNASSAAS
jgi:Flp pilus assembly pilin Flp